MVKDWKKEIARDTIALGSIPFYFIVMIRAIVGEYMPFVYQLLIAFVVLIALSFIVKKADFYVARCFVLFVFTSLFYKHSLYTVFAFLFWAFLIVSAHYLRVKKSAIVKRIVWGMVSSLVGYWLAGVMA